MKNNYDLLLSNMRGGIVVSHSPGHRQEAKEPGKAIWSPARDVVDVFENVVRAMLVLGLHQQGNGAGDEDEYVEDHVALGHLLHPVCRQGVDETTEDSQRCHDPNGRSSRGYVAETTSSVRSGVHGDSGE